MRDPDDNTNHQKTVLASTLAEWSSTTELEPCLVILSGKDQGKAFRLTKARNCFGRGDEADIVLADPKISRNHGAILIDGKRIELVDFRSTNGTYLDGVQIEQTLVGPNARILAGSTLMKVEFKLATEIEAVEKLFQAANTDPLTGVLNRRAFMEGAELEIARAQRDGTSLSVLMCDIDFFKKINDSYGHPVGDQVLRDLAAILQAQVREDDLLARFGGEEFILLLGKTDTATAVARAEGIRAMVEQHCFEFHGERIRVTLSMGVKCGANFETTRLESLIRDADAALYRAKHSGRNRVVVSEASVR